MARHREDQQAHDGRSRGTSNSDRAPRERTIAISQEEASSLLENADIKAYELMPSGSNYTFMVLMSMEGRGDFLAIYKPQRGERPLWDFPQGTLHRREHAAYIASRHLGWPNIPVTVIREGPFGIGSVQLYIPVRRGAELPALQNQQKPDLAEIALFDLLANNADRKAGHCLPGIDGRIWAIDHGLTFNVVPKMRTVLWDYWGKPIPQRLLERLKAFRDNQAQCRSLRSDLETDLQPEEIDAFFNRIEKSLRSKRFPRLDPNRNIPWPIV
ncbi:MAG: SCO1664 family protein [Chloroflexota bacterium]